MTVTYLVISTAEYGDEDDEDESIEYVGTSLEEAESAYHEFGDSQLDAYLDVWESGEYQYTTRPSEEE